MDWRRAKTILIISLLCLNIFLLVIYIKNIDSDKSNLNRELISILEENGVYFEKKEYNFPKSLGKLFVNYYEYNEENTARKFLGNNFMKNNKIYLNKDYYLEIDDNNILTFTKRGISLGENTTTIDGSIIIGKTFLESVDLLDDSVELVDAEIRDDYIVLNYRKVIGDKFVEKSYMEMEIFNGKIISFKRKWLNHDIDVLEKNSIISFERALYKLDSKLKASENIVIENVELGYVLGNDIFIQNIQSGEAFPYYKFYLNDGREIYIEAIDNYRGEI